MMNLRPFRFWCYKVLPLVYDDSLSYYEILCKVVKYINDLLAEVETTENKITSLESEFIRLKEWVEHYFDNLDVQEEINNKLDQMAEDGTLSELIREYLETTPFAEDCDSNIYGQFKDPDAWQPGLSTTAQSFCIFDHNDGQRLMACGRTGNRLQLDAINYDSDGRLNRPTATVYQLSSLGHMNDMTYCTEDHLLYIACGGGSDGIAKIVGLDPLTLQIEKTFDHSNVPKLQTCYSVAWSAEEEAFYVAERGYILKFDKDFNFLYQNYDIAPSYPNGRITAQSIFTDGKYLYEIWQVGLAPQGSEETAMINVMSIYHCKDMRFYRTMNVLIEGEVEAGCYYDGHYFLMKNKTRIGMVYEVYPYKDRHVGDFEYRNKIRSFNLTDAELATSNELWSDFAYGGFRVDGTETYPYGAMNNMCDDASYRMDTIALRLHIAGDEPYVLNIKKYEALRIAGYVGRSNQSAKIAGIHVRNGGELFLNDLTITSPIATFNAYLRLIAVNRFNVYDCTFTGLTADRFVVWCEFSSGIFSGCTFNAAYNEHMFRSSEGGYIYVYPNCVFNNNYDFYVNANVRLPSDSGFNYGFYQQANVGSMTLLRDMTNFDISKIRRGGLYKLAGTNTSIHVPSAISSGNFGFVATNISGASKGEEGTLHLMRYDVVTNSGISFL